MVRLVPTGLLVAYAPSGTADLGATERPPKASSSRRERDTLKAAHADRAKP
jgi:hypothetical protein